MLNTICQFWSDIFSVCTALHISCLRFFRVFNRVAMNSLLKNYGHSARQQAIKNVTGVAVDTGCISRTALLFLLTVAGILGASCKQDINGQHDPGGQAQVARADTLNKPEVKIKVNRKYDDKGNIIGFDSVYS